MPKLRILTPAGASFTTPGGGYANGMTLALIAFGRVAQALAALHTELKNYIATTMVQGGQA